MLEGQLRECFGRVVYSHKSHEKRADSLLGKEWWIKVIQILLSALTTAGFIGVAFGETQAATIAGLVFSVILFVLNAYAKNYDLGAMAQKHRQAAADLWFIRERYLSLLTDLRMRSRAIPELQKQRDGLLAELHEAYKSAPPTTSDSYAEAQRALKQNEELTFSDLEIDAFLPAELRRGQPPKNQAPTESAK